MAGDSRCPRGVGVLEPWVGPVPAFLPSLVVVAMKETYLYTLLNVQPMQTKRESDPRASLSHLGRSWMN